MWFHAQECNNTLAAYYVDHCKLQNQPWTFTSPNLTLSFFNDHSSFISKIWIKNLNWHCCFVLCRTAFGRWKRNGNIIILGSSRASRLPIFSFLITHPPSGKVLHHDFVAVLLNDLFGIQARGGCACAGPYAQVRLLVVLARADFNDYFMHTKDHGNWELKLSTSL